MFQLDVPSHLQLVRKLLQISGFIELERITQKLIDFLSILLVLQIQSNHHSGQQSDGRPNGSEFDVRDHTAVLIEL